MDLLRDTVGSRQRKPNQEVKQTLIYINIITVDEQQ